MAQEEPERGGTGPMAFGASAEDERSPTLLPVLCRHLPPTSNPHPLSLREESAVQSLFPSLGLNLHLQTEREINNR